MKKNERSLKEDLSLIFRGLREFDSILHGQMQLVILNSFIVSLTPYVPIYMSSRIINELTGERDKNTVLLHISCSYRRPGADGFVLLYEKKNKGLIVCKNKDCAYKRDINGEQNG